MNGILLVNKEKGLTSRDVVNKVSKKLNTNKIGHTGTLDPIATGVLVMCVGKATKIVELLTSMEKEYIAEVILGIKTDTLDITGTKLDEQSVDVSKEDLEKVLESFIGQYNQQVPLYSAVKINGKKLYEYARNNETVELPTRTVDIKKIQLIGDLYYQDNHLCFKFKCTVSKGTYIRSLIKDICDRLGVIGTMNNLTRTKQGQFKIEDCLNVEELSSDKLIDIKDVLDIPKYQMDEELYKKVINGQILDNKYHNSQVMFIYNHQAIAIYKQYEKDKNKIKPYCMFGGIK